jgi:hypothetical protein
MGLVGYQLLVLVLESTLLSWKPRKLLAQFLFLCTGKSSPCLHKWNILAQHIS